MLNRYQQLENSLRQASGVTELDLGTGFDRQTTAREVSEVSARASTLPDFERRQMVFMLRMVVDTSLRIAAKEDRDPVAVDIEGINGVINDLETPELSIESVMQEPSSILIDPEQLFANDNALKSAQQIEQYQGLLELAMAGLVGS